jgi:NAD(P)-dependent dehydrogenase (short-subunit alcohol dehydrogenase family)
MQLESKRALITGAGSGIGRALAVEAARRGMAVALCGRRREALEETAAVIGADREVLIVPADVTSPNDRRRLVERISSAWGALDILVNNAGVIRGGPLEKADEMMLEEILRVNVVAPIMLACDLLPLLEAARPSRIVNVGSMFGDIAYPGFAAYSTSKFALRGFSDALRREWAEKGIAVTYAAPRATDTDAAAAFYGFPGVSKERLDPPQQVAERIWRAVAKGDASVYARGPERLFVLIQRLLPRLIDQSIARRRSPAAV